MSDKVEQRRYSRSLMHFSVQVRLETGVLVEGCARDVSLSGLFFETERSLPIGSRVKIRMSGGEESAKTEIVCPGVVSRLDEGGVAIEWGDVDKMTLTCLCDFIRSAAEDAVRLEQELERRLDTISEAE